MKKLGLVGGIGPESTIPYYHDIVYGVQKRIGKNFFPNLVIESVNVFDVLRLCNERKYDELTNYLIQAIINLIASGADFIALSANTPHIVFDRLQEWSLVLLVSIVEATRDEAIRLGKHKTNSCFFRNHLRKERWSTDIFILNAGRTGADRTGLKCAVLDRDQVWPFKFVS